MIQNMDGINKKFNLLLKTMILMYKNIFLQQYNQILIMDLEIYMINQ